MSSSIRNYLLNRVYEDAQKLDLLYEIDAEDLDNVIPTSSLTFPAVTIVGGVAVSSAAVYSGSVCGGAIVGAGSLFAGGFCYYSSRTICGFTGLVHSIKTITREAIQVIRRREQVAFSQGLTTSREQRLYRLKVLEALRSIVIFLEGTSRDLAAYLEGEDERLLANYYSKEIDLLLSEDISEDSTFNSNGAIATLADVAALHISALSRLYLLYIRNSSIPLLQIFFFSRRMHNNLAPILDKLQGLAKSPVRVAKTKQQRDTGVAAKIEDHEAVALVLDNISSNILSKTVSPKDARIALQKVLFMEWLRVPENDPVELGQPEVEVDVTDRICMEVQKRDAPPVDQVFEAVAEETQTHAKCWDEDFTLEMAVQSRSLMGELRMALSDRSKEFEARERKALATFYGITEEELERREEEEEQRIKQKQEELEAMGEAVDEPEHEKERRAPLAPDLLQALARRGPVKEDILGDSSDDE